MFSSTRSSLQKTTRPSKIGEKITLGTFEVYQMLTIMRSRTFQYITVHSTVIRSTMFLNQPSSYQYVHEVPLLDISFHICHNKVLRW
jgi:hypothetical protein